MRIGFLFNHQQTHQVAHSAPIGFELATARPEAEVVFLASNAAQETLLQDMAERYGGGPGRALHIERLALPAPVRLPAKVLDIAAPATSVAMLRWNLNRFRRFDAIVTPEKTSLLLKTRFGLDDCKIIHTRHGAGDRAVGFNAASGKFDLVLLSGEKIKDRLAAAGQLDAGRWRIVGYPKFDAVGAFSHKPIKLFDNNRPTVFYNPHGAPHLSSWYAMGREILEYFYQSTEYNLIFAPHVMLFQRRLHISLETGGAKHPGRIDKKFHNCPHILIDAGSPASVDMTYALNSDIYLGDSSSQIYEFLVRPRPCIFLNPQGLSWEGDDNFLHWTAGRVARDMAQLDSALRAARRNPDEYKARQQELFAYSFDLTDVPSARRAADAIYEFLN